MNKLTEAQERFLRELLGWQGIASSQDLAPQMSQADNSARQTCKRRGWVTFDGPGGYWRITPAGRLAISGKADSEVTHRTKRKSTQNISFHDFNH